MIYEKDLIILLIVISSALLVNFVFFKDKMGKSRQERTLSAIIVICASALGWVIGMSIVLFLGG